MCLVHGRYVRHHQRHRISNPDTAFLERRSEAPATVVALLPGDLPIPVNNSDVVRDHKTGGFDETKRRQGNVVRAVLVESEVIRVDVGHDGLHSSRGWATGLHFSM